jgi:SNF2 family DNA or RNA helicase
MTAPMMAAQAHINVKHRRMVVPFVNGLSQLTPGSLAFEVGGQKMLALPHDATHVRLAHNFGIAAPAPILHYYDWAGSTPFEAQRQTAAGLTTHDRFYVLNGMGTGKTRAVVFAYDFLRSVGEAKRMLVVAPLSTLTMTWYRELFMIAPHLKVNVLYGSRDKRLRMLDDPADVYIVNHDGAEIITTAVAARADIDVVCLDELAVYRNGGSKRFKVMNRLLSTKKRVWGLTGSPTPNAPTDAWAQTKLITPWKAPTGFGSFRESVMYKVTTFKWVAKPSALQTVRSMMQPSVRYTLDDVVELPDLVVRKVDIEQGPLQKKAYAQLETHMHGLFDKGEITVQNAGILMNKLLQVSLGWVYTDTRGIVSFDNDARKAALLDAVESTDNKVIVFVPFIHALDGVADHLRKNDMPCEIVSGQTPQSERNRIFGAFQNSSEPRVIVAHPQCMAHGLTLTAADTIIWFGPFASLEVFEQANQRIRRVGQKHKQQILLFSGTRAESKLYDRLQQKKGVQDTLLDMFREDTGK